MARSLRTFDEARRYAPYEIARVEVPYEQTSLPAYFVPAMGPGAARRPAAIFICGLDTTKELWFLRARTEFAERGISALFIDTPGIGEALRLRGLVTRPTTRSRSSAALDWLSARPEVDAQRIGVVGSSLGGYYVTRAAAFEPRLRAAVAWGVIYDYREVWVKRLAAGRRGRRTEVPADVRHWRRHHGRRDGPCSRLPRAEIGSRVSCPFLLMHGAADRQVPEGDARAMFDAIGSPDKEMVIFERRKRRLGALPVRQPSSCAAGMRRLAGAQACTMKGVDRKDDEFSLDSRTPSCEFARTTRPVTTIRTAGSNTSQED